MTSGVATVPWVVKAPGGTKLSPLQPEWTVPQRQGRL